MRRHMFYWWGILLLIPAVLVTSCGGGKGNGISRPDEAESRLLIADLTHHFVENFNAQDIDAMLELSSGFIEVGSSIATHLPQADLPSGTGRDFLREYLETLFAAYPDMQLTLTEAVATFDGDHALYNFSFTLTSGEATITFPDSITFEFVDGAWKLLMIGHQFNAHNEGEGETL